MRDGSSPGDDVEGLFAEAAQRITQILLSTGILGCEMTLKMGGGGDSQTETLTISSDEDYIEEYVVPDYSGLNGIYAVLSDFKDGT